MILNPDKSDSCEIDRKQHYPNQSKKVFQILDSKEGWGYRHSIEELTNSKKESLNLFIMIFSGNMYVKDRNQRAYRYIEILFLLLENKEFSKRLGKKFLQKTIMFIHTYTDEIHYVGDKKKSELLNYLLWKEYIIETLGDYYKPLSDHLVGKKL